MALRVFATLLYLNLRAGAIVLLAAISFAVSLPMPAQTRVQTAPPSGGSGSEHNSEAAPAPPDSSRQTKAQKRHGPACTSPEEASKSPNKEACVAAHVYDVVELSDGTRFLDVCPPDTPDDQCRFTLLSLREDREDVGDLRKYRDQDVSVRGVVRVTHGRMGIVISHVRQFGGGPEKFRPNPKLVRGFNGQSERAPVRDPNLAPSGHHRSFMNTRDRETLPEAQKP